MIRPPVVTILGHVDHGKTTLLDYIRKSHITKSEYGGITQKIGGYEITTHLKGYPTNKITFIDTPGHEAFSQLRARGAMVADIAILIIDAVDSLMPQTLESISHIKSAHIPFIVAINKIDLPGSNPEKIKNDLLKHEVITEDKGGAVPVVLISAKTGKGIEELLETILFIASDLNLTYDPSKAFNAYIIETKKDRRGVVVSAIIKEGVLKVGNTVYVQNKKHKIRSLIDDRGGPIEQASPSLPFEMLGFDELPPVGSAITPIFQALKEEELSAPLKKSFTLNDILQPEKKERRLALIIKTDSQGSLDAVDGVLSKNKNVDVVLKAVGMVNKSDVFLAKTTKAIIIGFNVFISPEVKEISKQEKVIIKTYNIIYELLGELEEVALLLKEKEEKEKNLKGEAKIVATFIIEGETIYGIKVTKGKINLNDQLDLYRNNKLIGKTKLISLKSRARIIQEIKKDQEAGMIFSPPLDIAVGDVVKSIL